MKKFGFKYVLYLKGDLARYYSSLNGVTRALKHWSDKGFECRAYDYHTGERVGRQ